MKNRERSFAFTSKHKHLLTGLTNGMANYQGADMKSSSHWKTLMQQGYVRFESNRVHITDKGITALAGT